MIVPDPKSALDPNDPRKSQRFYTKDFPIQSFLWGDYAAAPGTAYRFRILPMYGKPGALTSDPKDELKLEIQTEKEWEEPGGRLALPWPPRSVPELHQGDARQ